MYGQPVHVGEYKPIKRAHDQDEARQDNYHERGNDLTGSGKQDGASGWIERERCPRPAVRSEVLRVSKLRQYRGRAAKDQFLLLGRQIGSDL